ncbi:MAG: biotin transporter BioY [Bacillota bacterium]
MKIAKRTQDIVHIALMTAITIGLSFVRIPFYPVPFTLQTLAAMLAGIMIKSWAGVSSQLLYIALGLIGLPIFSQGGGLGYIFNPTFGYILFLPLLTFLVSILYKRIGIFGLIAPSILLLFFGTVYYLLFINTDKTIDAVFMGFMVIFIPAEIIKSLCAYFLGIKLRPILKLS